MKNASPAAFFTSGKPFISGVFELTYRCNYSCIHCYCRGARPRGKELGLDGVLRVLDHLRSAGCVWLAFSGGEPLMRRDFPEIYRYARERGFVIDVFTNGSLITRELAREFSARPPRCVEITLNAVAGGLYDRITATSGLLGKVKANIRLLKKRGIPVVVKADLLSLNAGELGKIKRWTKKALGEPGKKFLFKYDSCVYPRFSGDTWPCSLRLPSAKFEEALRTDRDLWRQYRDELRRPSPPRTSGDRLYLCDCRHAFFIDPSGWLRACAFSGDFCFDAKRGDLAEGLARMRGRMLERRFQSDSPCRSCRHRLLCDWCPGKASLETGDPEAPIGYFCERTAWLRKRTAEVRG